MIEALRELAHPARAPAAAAPPRTFNGASLRWTPGPDELRLPCEGEKVPQSSRQTIVIVESISCLVQHWRERPDVFVGSDQFIYWRRDKPGVAPDVFVAFGVAKRHHTSYVVWEERKPPDFVLEVLSRSSRRQDREDKLDLYAEMAVPEYFWFDPEDKADPALAGFDLHGGAYEPLPEETVAEGVVGIRSKVLGLCLCVRPTPSVFDCPLRWYDLAAGKFLRVPSESDDYILRLTEDKRGLADDKRRLADDNHRLADDKRRLADDNRRLEARVAELEAILERKPHG